MKPTILFVDDEPKVLATLRRMFMRDCNVLVAEEGKLALRLLAQHKVDVLVCDQRMPEMAGIEVLRAAREISPRTVRIVLTGYADLDAAIRAMNEGEVYKYVSKPWSNEELLVTVLGAAKKAQSADAEVHSEEIPEDQSIRITDCGLLILDKDRDLVNSIMFGLGDQASTFTADTPDNALQIMRAQDIGVLIADSDMGGEETTNAIFKIKKLYPDLVVMIVTFRSDIVHVMELINSGQIFRFIPKPTNFNILEPNIRAAVQAYFRTPAGKVLREKRRLEEAGPSW